MERITPIKLKHGDEVRVIAPARSLAIISDETKNIANKRFAELGLKISFSKHVMESDLLQSSSVPSRIFDLHEAFIDSQVKAIFTVLGGFNSNHLLSDIDYELIAKNPKILCGFSDITAIQNAIYAKTGLITYSGCHYSSLGMEKGLDYSIEYLKKCLFSNDAYQVESSETWSDDFWYQDQKNRIFIKNDGPWVIQEGEAEGTIIGGNLSTFSLLKGTDWFPSLKGAILLLEEDDLSGNDTAVMVDRDLQSLTQQKGFDKVKGIVIGRFQKSSKITRQILNKIVQDKKELKHIPVIANVDFGHTTPMITFPIGGTVKVNTKESCLLEITHH